LKSEAQTPVNVNYPGATHTKLYGINNEGVIVGAANGNTQVFTLSNGVFTNVPDNPASVGTLENTTFGINDNGDIVGSYNDKTLGEVEGFLLKGGTYTTIRFPGSLTTTVSGINNSDEIVGSYTGSTAGVFHGFMFSNGTYQTIDYPGAKLTSCLGINNAGTIVGTFSNTNNIGTGNILHGFVYNAGHFAELHFPGSTNTDLGSINDSGAILGSSDSSLFVYANGQFKPLTITPPAPDTGISSIAFNNSEQIVGGSYVPSSGIFEGNGFVLSTGPYAYVPISNGNVVSVYDTTFDVLAATIPVGAAPFDAAVSPNGSRVYVDNSNSNTVSVIDPTNNSVVATVPVGSIPAGIAVTPDSSTIYVATHGNNSVSVVNAATNTVTATVPVGSYPFLLAITPNGSHVYVPNFQSNNVSVISTATNTVVAVVPVGLAPQSVAISPDGKLAYVTCTNSNLVYVIDTATNTVTKTIPVSNGPLALTISPNGASAYVSEYFGATTAVINTANESVIASVPVGVTPYGSAITPDGASLWQTNSSASSISVISTATNNVVTTIPLPGSDFNVGIGPATPTSQTISMPLSPTAPNVFNFGAHTFTVQYPPGTTFSGVNMTITAAQTTQQTFKQRVAGGQFANATCIVYAEEGGNCEDYQVTCSTASGGSITCPSVPTASIAVKTSFDTQQQIINPGFLTTPIGTNNWTNIFESFSLQRIDPTMKGRTRSFSEFVAVDLGMTNGQGAGTPTILDPLRQSDTRIFPAGTIIPVHFTLSSLASPGTPVTDATAGLSVVRVSDSNGHLTSNIVLDSPAGFIYSGGQYTYSLNTAGYAPGTYDLTIYGNAFAAQQIPFTVPTPTMGAHLVTTVQSLTRSSPSKQYIATFAIANTGTGTVNGVIVTSSQLDGAPTSTGLPISLGDIGPGSSMTVSIAFPVSAGPAGSRGALTINETFAGGTSGGGFRITLP
jgi:YVTN family beta-propeller protein